MRLPAVPEWLAPRDPELKPYRPGWRFAFFNALTWQVATGAPVVLLAELLGASSAQAGLAYSFLYLLTPVQVAATVLVPRLGYRRQALAGWGWRPWLLLVPLGLAVLAPMTGVRSWMADALIVSCFFFCLLRSMGMAASIPWMFAILPPGWRGRYFGSEYMMSGLASMIMLVASASLFAWLEPFPALAWQYAIALAGSALSYHALARLPDAPPPPRLGWAEVLRSLARMAFSPSGYRTYLWISVGCYAVTTPLIPYTVYHLRADAGMSSGWVMLLELVRYTGSVAAALLLRRRLDATGAKPYMMLSLGLYGLLALWWLVSLRQGDGGLPAFAAAWLLMGLAGTCWAVGNLSYLPKLIGDGDRLTGISLQGALASLAGGAATTLWGAWLRIDGGGTGMKPAMFAGLFAVAIAGVLVLMAALAGLKEPDVPSRPVLSPGALLLRPHRALACLINLIDPRK